MVLASSLIFEGKLQGYRRVITPREPNLDFHDVPVHWSPNAEFAQIINAKSTAAPLTEPFLCQVMSRVHSKISDKDKKIKDEVRLFIRQEGIHYQVHSAFNQRLYDSGYNSINASEYRLREDYVGFLNKKSLKFNLAYCVGFETAALNAAFFFYENLNDLLEDANATMVDLWLWHTGEEFEHRSVCEDAYNHLYGGYFMRIYGLVYSFVHLGRYYGHVADLLLQQDRAAMTPQEVAASKKRAKIIQRRFKRFFIPKMWKLFLPWYDPTHVEPPKDLEEKLARFQSA